jgi:hypothetical protein
LGHRPVPDVGDAAETVGRGTAFQSGSRGLNELPRWKTHLYSSNTPFPNI